MSEIIPAILAKTVEDFLEKIGELPGAITFVHFDVLEEDIWEQSVRDDGLLSMRDFEVHLMVEDPERIAERWVERGAKRIITHKIDETLTRCRDKAEVGLGVEIDKSLDEFSPFLDFVDFVHLMSIKEIGHQGHPFDERIFDRIKEVRKDFPNLPISVDGGITKNNYQSLIDTGANRLIVGSHFQEVWHSLTTK